MNEKLTNNPNDIEITMNEKFTQSRTHAFAATMPGENWHVPKICLTLTLMVTIG